MPSLYQIYAEDGVKFVFIISAVMVTFLLISASIKNVEVIRMAGAGRFIISSATVISSLLLLNTVAVNFHAAIIPSVMAASITSTVIALSHKLRRIDTIYRIFVLSGFILIGIIHLYPFLSLIPALILAYAFVRRC